MKIYNVKKLKCYYAHTMLSYGSFIEKEDIALLEKLGFEVENPNQEKHQIGCQEYAKEHGKETVMDYFATVIDSCDLVAFRGNPDGSILSGVGYEIAYTKKIELPVIELPCRLHSRSMSYPETKEYLAEVGYYKD